MTPKAEKGMPQGVRESPRNRLKSIRWPHMGQSGAQWSQSGAQWSQNDGQWPQNNAKMLQKCSQNVVSSRQLAASQPSSSSSHFPSLDPQRFPHFHFGDILGYNITSKMEPIIEKLQVSMEMWFWQSLKFWKPAGGAGGRGEALRIFVYIYIYINIYIYI